MEQITRSLKESLEFKSDQSKIWNEIRRKLYVTATHSPTAELHQAYMEKEKELREYVERVSIPKDANGVVVAIGGRIWCADVFDKPSSLAKLWRKLSLAYAMDALEERKEKLEPLCVDDAGRFLKQAIAAKFEAFGSPGLGKDVRIEGNEIIGSALVFDDKVLHLSLFSRNIEEKPATVIARPRVESTRISSRREDRQAGTRYL